jgi:hypothetical protein
MGTAAYAAHIFNDVSGDNVHADAIAWAVENGITLGCDDDGNFCPDDPTSREQMVEFLYRLSGADPDAEPVVDAATVNGLTADQLRAQVGPAGLQGPEGPEGPAGSQGLTGPAGTPGPQNVAVGYSDEDGEVAATLGPITVTLDCAADGSALLIGNATGPDLFEAVFVFNGFEIFDGGTRDIRGFLPSFQGGPFEVFGRTLSGITFRIDGYASLEGGDCDGAFTLAIGN